ncbi:MAG: hypothetical protein JRH20_23695, partial [Deltaproteobacteria bacterium]|nr:hypothetical protein [Deltaproteobacteria bacterium]
DKNTQPRFGAARREFGASGHSDAPSRPRQEHSAPIWRLRTPRRAIAASTRTPSPDLAPLDANLAPLDVQRAIAASTRTPSPDLAPPDANLAPQDTQTRHRGLDKNTRHRFGASKNTQHRFGRNWAARSPWRWAETSGAGFGFVMRVEGKPKLDRAHEGWLWGSMPQALEGAGGDAQRI